jgi:hypothetical protein
MENIMPSWQCLYSSNLIVESFRVFNNPVKIPQWILPLITELKEFSSPLCLSAHLLNAHLEEYLLLSLAQYPPGRALRILSDSVPSELTVEFYLCAPLALAQCPLGRASQNPQ